MFNYEIENNEYDNLEECVNEVYELASKYAIDGVKNNIGGPFGAGIIYKKENGKYIIHKVMIAQLAVDLEMKEFKNI